MEASGWRPDDGGYTLPTTRCRPVNLGLSNPCVFCSFAQVTLGEVLGNHPPRAFVGLDEAARVRLYWDLKAQSTALRGQEHVAAQTPPVRFGPNRDQRAQPRPGRRARVLSAAERQARLAQEGQPAAQPPPARPPSPPSSSQPTGPPAATQPAAPTPVSQPASGQPAFSYPVQQPASQSVPLSVPEEPQSPESLASQLPHMEWSASSFPQTPQSPASQSPRMEWSPLPFPQPVQSPASCQPVHSSLFPQRPSVFCIPASPPPLIPSRPLLFSLPARPPPFPIRTSLFSLNQPPPIPPRPFIFSVRSGGFHPRPYFLSGQCVQICPPVIPQRLFFMSGQCVSQFPSFLSYT